MIFDFDTKLMDRRTTGWKDRAASRGASTEDLIDNILFAEKLSYFGMKKPLD